MLIKTQSFARAGLIGNPSDGYLKGISQPLTGKNLPVMPRFSKEKAKMKKNVEIEFDVDRLLAGAEEIVAHKAGKVKLCTWSIDPMTGERQKAIRAGKKTALKIVTKRAPLSAENILQIRMRLGISQGVFAAMLNVPDSTERAWERGLRRPAGAAQRLLQIADRAPELLMELV